MRLGGKRWTRKDVRLRQDLDFCTPRYVIMRELVMDKFRGMGFEKGKKMWGKD